MPNILVGTVSAIALVMGFAVGGCDTFSGSNTPRGGTTGDTTRSDTNRGGTTGSGIAAARPAAAAAAWKAAGPAAEVKTK
jgi:phage tail tape-measure protein